MADAAATGSPNWTDIFIGLPPPVQFVIAAAAGVTIGYIVYVKFLKQLHGEGPKSTDLMVGGPTTFADMTPLRDLVANVEQLTLQMMKSAVAADGMTAGVASAVAQMAAMTVKMGQLCDLVGQHIVDLREEREAEEKEEIEQRGYERGLADRKPVRRAPRRKPPPKP